MSHPLPLTGTGALGEQVGGSNSVWSISSSTRHWTWLKSDSVGPKTGNPDDADGTTRCTGGAQSREATKHAKVH
ncbi:unnamed protein product [Phytophthora fragariaefolia]|uniref:Unnamed protein product n=1 Tax=Phytophthora fragariaefolia TaxID=1490495 RepID=A0A9W6X982_9STRA|nr:unnamed protein product [Phytophthora fragariaefolia]